MTIRIFTQLSVICYAIFCFINIALGSIQLDLKQATDINSILSLSTKYGKDTIALKEHITPILKEAKKQNNTPILWAYNILMADTYSIIFDNTNPISDKYYESAKSLLKNKDLTELEFAGNVREGYYHFIYRKITQAVPYFLAANHLKNDIKPENVPDLENHYRFIASFYNYIGNHNQAISYLNSALPFTQKASRERIDMLNAIAVYSKNNETEAKRYYEEALAEAIAAKDSVWIGIIQGNLSEYYLKEGKIQESIDYLKSNIKLSLQYNEPLDAMRASLHLAQLYVKLNDSKNAKKYVEDALSLMEDKPYFLAFKVDATLCLSKIAKLNNNQQDELKYLNQYIELKEKLDTQKNNEEIAKVGLKFEVENFENTLRQNEIKKKELIITYVFIIISIILASIVIILLINKSKNAIKIKNFKLEKDQLTLAKEKQTLNSELTHVKNSLTEFIEKVKENDNVISQLKLQLESNNELNDQMKSEVNAELNTLLQTHLMTQDRWETFQKEFEQMYPNYLFNLKINHPSLTENDIRIHTLSKLNLSNNSMSNLLGISIDGVKKAKQRLKKKLTSSENETF